MYSPNPKRVERLTVTHKTDARIVGLIFLSSAANKSFTEIHDVNIYNIFMPLAD